MYPNSWYVVEFCDYDARGEGTEWKPILGSVGNKSYATGYANALDSMYPHPAYRLINAKGEVAKEYHPRVNPRFG